ncbi:MAG: phosphate ABC transporter substrate-binding protein PstS, partial [Cyanobacteriota bacterium]|nr:phosphate ABC transporter substrate-binding protein PstS [Cyanobacteriota bacterium]
MLQRFTEQIDLRKAFALALVAGLAACGGTATTDTTEGTDEGTETAAADGGEAGEKIFDENVSITGAGASFPAPLYQNWFTQLNGKVPELQVNYQSVGSGAGVEQFTAETVNFGASDVAMSDEEIDAVGRGTILLPMTAGAIVLAYNLPGVEELQLSRDVYTNILLGNITTWSDPAIAEINEGIELPDTPITVVHRSDGSGTTGVFTMHLSDISPDFESQIGQ